MIRRHPDAAALLVLGLALCPAGALQALLPPPAPAFSVTPAVHASSSSRAGESLEHLLQRFEQRRERVWQRLDQRLREFERRLADQERSRRVRSATRLAS